MKDHLDPETLSAYIDEEIDLHQRDRIDSHVTRCSDCRGLLDLLRGAASAVSRLDEVEVTSEEHRMIRQAVLAARPGIRRWGPIWGFAGAGALIVVGVFGFLNLQRQPGEVQNSTADKMLSGPQQAPSFEFVTDEQIRSVVSSQAKVVSGIDKFTVADVGTQQEPAIYAALVSPEAVGRTRTQRTAEDLDAVAGAPSSEAFDPAAGQVCIRKVLRSQPYPMIPLLATRATYKQKSAWLLVYAFTADQTSTSRLDRAQIWLISPEQCARLEGPALINAAYHYSFYRKP